MTLVVGFRAFSVIIFGTKSILVTPKIIIFKFKFVNREISQPSVETLKIQISISRVTRILVYLIF